MSATYRIHPGIGIARLGNSPDEFCISPEGPGRRPTACDDCGNPLLSPDGKSERTVETFKDAAGRIKRQAARFQIYVVDDEHPDGRPLRLGDRVEGGGNSGRLVDIRWRVYLANKKSVWYEFKQLEGEHGYADSHPRRNADIKDPQARQQLIIDPGPRIIDCTERRTAEFHRDSEVYAPTFPPPLEPRNIDTLGEIKTDNEGRLLVLGGLGHSGSFKHREFGEPRITSYANNDGWFDDTSDGSVMARLVMFDETVQRLRFVDVEYPAWVLCGYPAYAPEILDLVTLEDVLEDLSIRRFATRQDIYGRPGHFDDAPPVPADDSAALAQWSTGALQWNRDYKPWFFRDIWPVLFRPDEFVYLTSILGLSNYPHNQSGRGSFDPHKLSLPPRVNPRALRAAEAECRRKHRSGELLLEHLEAELMRIESQVGGRALEFAAAAATEGGPGEIAGAEAAGRTGAAVKKRVDTFVVESLFEDFQPRFKAVVQEFVGGKVEQPQDLPAAVDALLVAFRSERSPRVTQLTESIAAGGEPARRAEKVIQEGLFEELSTTVSRVVEEHLAGALLARGLAAAKESATEDPFRGLRNFLYGLLRQPGEENVFSVGKRPDSRGGNQPLMPLLNGDNPISNTLTSKFFRLTDYQLFLLRQWRDGKFYNEAAEGWANPDPFNPYASWENRTARDLDRGVLSNLLGGSFCPGAEVTWIIRNPAIYREPYRIKADPNFFNFQQTAANANQLGQAPDEDYISATSAELSQDSDFEVGLQPGDLTKYMAVPWQSDFNECTTQTIDVTYDEWNRLYPDSENDEYLRNIDSSWETMWWPAHRPLQTFEMSGRDASGAPEYQMLDWSRGVPGSPVGDAKMVTAWSDLGFVVLNPHESPEQARTPTEVPPIQKYISVERNQKEDA